MDAPAYFTYPSPFAYLAWHRVASHPERYAKLRLTWTPVLFRRLMALQGGPATGSPPLQLAYNYADADRWAAAYGIPLAHFERKVPADQTAHRLHLLAQDAGRDWEARWMKAVFTLGRVQGTDLTDGAAVRRLAEQVGLPGRERADAPELDARLEANTQQALRDGVCGVPFIRHAGQAYWGNDRLAWLEAHLAGKPHPEV
ncbi:MAG TPA: DsbA family protein [Candidatus Thermoplasmatota archaeon]|nr:DsbA family protein [Candidatus Thermoplasmatota archaeon]